MVAVVSGNGLGLFNTSLTQLGLPLGGSSGTGQTKGSQVVNIATGDLILQDQDESLSVRGMSTSFLRTYNSRGTLSGQDGFITGYERTVTLNGDNTVTMMTGDGSSATFTSTGSNSWTSTAGEGAHDTLVWDTGTSSWAYTEGSTRRQETYDASGRLTQIRDLSSDGSTPAVFNVYYTNGLVSEVRSVDDTGNGTGADAILFEYTGTQLTAISTREGGVERYQVSYGYDTCGRLAWVQQDLKPNLKSAGPDTSWDATASLNDGERFRTTYNYVAASASDLRLASVTQSDGTVTSYTYEEVTSGSGNWRVKTVTSGDETVSFNYTAGQTDVTDSLGRTWTYKYDAQQQLTEVDAPTIGTQRDATTYQYDAAGNLTQVMSVRGATVLSQMDYTYDANGNQTGQWDLAGNAVSRTYTTTNQLASSTSYTGVDGDRTGAGLPGGTALTTRYLYDGQDRLQYAFNANGELTEYSYAASGNGVGQRASERHYLGAPYTGATDDNSLRAWAAAANKATSTLVEYSYDAKGRLNQATGYASVDASGNGTLDAGTQITRFVYDAQGLLLQQVTLRGVNHDTAGANAAGSEVVDYTYDGMGRLLSVLKRDYATASLATAPNPQGDPSGYAAWDAATVLTSYAYTDSGNKIVVTLDSGATTTTQYNTARRLTRTDEVGGAVIRTTQNFYDRAGFLRASQDATGALSYFFYDEAGRLSDTVDATGAVNRTIYDDTGRAIQTVGYAVRVDTTSWFSGGAVGISKLLYSVTQPTLNTGEVWVCTDAARDRNSYRSYDDAGRVWKETDAAGLETAYVYDGASRLLSTTISKPGDGTVIPRVTRFFYDAANRLVATLDAAGYLIESSYDAGGRVVGTTRYANPTNSAYRASGTLAQLKSGTWSADAANDQAARYFYDGRGNEIGRLEYVANGAGYLTESIIDEAGNTRAVKAYAKQLTGLSGAESLTALRTSATTGAPPEPYQLSQRAYNALGQVVTETNAEGTVTRYGYDDAGRLLRTEWAYNTSEVRENYARYDAFGQIIGELSGQQAADAVAYAQATYGKALTDPTLTGAQLDGIYGAYGVRNNHDLVGRLTDSTDANGAITWYFYDADSRLTFTVRGVKDANGIANAAGEVTETRYTAFGQVCDSIAYTGRISIGAPYDRSVVSSAIAMLSALGVQASDSRQKLTYDTRGLLASLTDAENKLTQNSYTAFGQLYETQRGVGTDETSVTRFEYDIRGLQTKRTDGQGSASARSVSQTYDAFGRVDSSTDGRLTVSTYRYDRLGRQLTASRNAEGRAETTTNTYDAFARVLSVKDALNNTTTYTYSNANRSMTVTSAMGVAITTVHNRSGQSLTVTQSLPNVGTSQVTYAYDKSGNLLSVSDALGGVTSYTLDRLGNVVLRMDASGRNCAYTYDAVGRVLTRTEDSGSGKLNLTTTMAYDGQGRQITVTDPSGCVTTYSYDREGRLTQSSQDPLGLNLCTTYTYDALGRQVEIVEGEGTLQARVTRYEFDTLGRRTAEHLDPDGLDLITRYTYDGNDNVVGRTDANNKLTRFTYDEANRLRFTIDAAGGVVETLYDADSRVRATRSYAKIATLTSLAVAPAIAAVQNLVSSQGLLDDSKDAVTYQIYDADGRVRYAIDAMYGATENSYDSAGRLVATRRYATAITNSTLIGKIKAGTAVVADFTSALLPANSSLDTRNFVVLDASGQARFTLDSLGNVSEARYDAAGRLVERVAYAVAADSDLLGAVTAGTATAASFAGFVASHATNAHAVSTVYDGAGRVSYLLTRMDASHASVLKRTYDAAGRVIAETTYGKVIAYASGLDAGQVAGAVTSASGDAAGYQRLSQMVYDKAGRLRYTIDDAGYVSERIYFADGSLDTSKEYGNSISLSGTPTEATVSTALASGQPDVHATSYEYDSAGRVRNVYDAFGKHESFGYDAVGRRTSYTNKLGYTWTTEYDAAGNVTKETTPTVRVWSFNASGTLVYADRAVVTSMTYDALGNLASRTENAGQADARTTQYSYDARGRQVRTLFPNSMKLDASGNWVSNGAAPEVNISYDALDRAVVQKDVRGNYSYKVYDQLGQLAYDVDADGYVTRYSYDAYGQQTGLTRYANKLTFSGSTFSGWAAGKALTIAQAATVVASAAADRSMTVSYDQRGNKVAVEQAAIAYYKADGSAGGSLAPRTEFSYDAYGNLTRQSVLVEAGVWAHTYNYYDELGQRTLSVDAEGYVTRWQYDAFGQVSEQIEFARAISTAGLGTSSPPGLPTAGDSSTGYDRCTSYFYDQLGRKVGESVLRNYQTLDGVGHQADVLTEFVYDDADHLAKSIVHGTGNSTNTTVTQYDALGHALNVTEQARSVLAADWQAQLISSGTKNLNTASLTATTSPYSEMSYDAFGNVVKVYRSALGKQSNGTVAVSAYDQITTTQYDRQGRAVLSTDPAGKVTSTVYDAADNVLSQSYKLSDRLGHYSTITHTYTYDGSSRELTHVTERKLYSGATVTDAREAVAYNAFGEVTAKGQVAGDLSDQAKSAWYVYDKAGNITSSNADGGAFRRYGFTLAGVQVREERDWTDAGVSKTAVYTQAVDKLGRVVKVVSPSWNGDSAATATTTARLDRWGNVLEQVDARGYDTQCFYNGQNQLIRQLAPLVKVVSETGAETWTRPETKWLYDSLGRLVKEIDANGHSQVYSYDDANRIIKTTDATNADSLSRYDALGRALASQDALGYITYVDYDAGGRATAQGDFLLNDTGNGHAKAKLQAYTIDQDGNRLTVTTTNDGTTNLVQKYDYDGRGLLLRSETAAGVTETFAYDLSGRKTQEVDGLGGTLAWTYDYFGRIKTHTDLSGLVFTSTYDANSGLLATVKATGATRAVTYFANGLTHTMIEDGSTYVFGYDAVGNRTLEESTTTDGSGEAVHVVTRTIYDSQNRVARITSDDATHGVRMLDLSYDYDAVGNRRRVQADTSYGPAASPVTTADRDPIVVGTPGNVSVEKSKVTTWSIRASDYFRDPENGTLTYALGGSPPAWLKVVFNAATGMLDFTATNPSTGTNFSIQLTASDGAGTAATTNFTITLFANHAPTVANAILDQSVEVNQAWNYTVPANTFADEDGQALSYSVGNLPEGLSFDAATRTLTGTPTASGRYAITVTASDGSLSVPDTFMLTVTGPNAPPTVANSIPNQILTPSYNGGGWSFQFAAETFADADTLTYTQSGMPSWMTFTPGTRRFSGAGTLVGTSTIIVTATDTSGQSASTSFTVTVNDVAPVVANPIPDQSGSVGSAFSYTLPSNSFVDPNSSQTLTYSASGLPGWLSFDAAQRKFTGTPTSTGSSTIEVSATDPSGHAISAQFVVTVNAQSNQAPVVSHPVADQIATRQQAWSYTIPANAFTDANGDALTYSYAKTHGQAAWLSFNPATRTFSGTPNNISNSIVVSVTATDPSGASVTDEFIIQVVPAGNTNGAPVASHPVADQYATRQQAFSFTLPANAFIDPNGDALDYTISTIVGTAPWLSFNATTRTFSGTPQGAANDVTIRIYATDPNGLLAYTDCVIHVSSAAQGFMAQGSNFKQASLAQMEADRVAQPTELQPPPELPPPGDDDDSGDTSTGDTSTGGTSTGGTSTGGTSAGGTSSGNTSTGSYGTTSPGSTANHQDYWFTYDNMNRVTVANGALDNRTIVVSGKNSWGSSYDAAGHAVLKLIDDGGVVKSGLIVVDARGQVVLEYHAGSSATSGGKATQRTFDKAGHVLSTTEYYAASEVKVVVWAEGGWHTPPTEPGGTPEPPETHRVVIAIGGWTQNSETYTYDADGRVVTGQVRHRSTDWRNLAEHCEGNPNFNFAPYINNVALYTQVYYTTASGASGYDAAGRLVTHRVDHWGVFTTTFTHSYLGRDGWVESGVSSNSTPLQSGDATSYRDGSTASVFDAWGHRDSLTETTPLSDWKTTLTSKRFFAYDANGAILLRRDGTMEDNVWTQSGNGYSGSDNNPAPDYITDAQWTAMSEADRKLWQGRALNQHFVFSDGQQVAQINEAGLLKVAGAEVDVDSFELGTSTTTVDAGETLRDVAQRVYGNASYWYVLAGANAIVSDGALAEGQMLKVPEVKVAKNDATTFKPYNPAEATGPTEPGTPYIAGPPPAAHCSAMAMVIRVLAVVVACFIPEASPWVYAAIAGIGETMAQATEIGEGVRQGYDAAAIGASALMAGVMATGPLKQFGGWADGFKGIEKFGANVLVGATQATMSSLATTALQKALGEQTHFSWKDVGAGALSAGIASGLLNGLSAAQSTGSDTAGTASNATTLKAPPSFNWKAALRAASSAVLREGIGYEVRKAAFGQAEWSWSNVAYSVATEVLGTWGASVRQQRRLNQATLANQTDGFLASFGAPSDSDNPGNSFGALGSLSMGSDDLEEFASFGSAESSGTMFGGGGASTPARPRVSGNVASATFADPYSDVPSIPDVIVTGDPNYNRRYFSAWQYAILTGSSAPHRGMTEAQLRVINDKNAATYADKLQAYTTYQNEHYAKQYIQKNSGPQSYAEWNRQQTARDLTDMAHFGLGMLEGGVNLVAHTLQMVSPIGQAIAYGRALYAGQTAPVYATPFHGGNNAMINSGRQDGELVAAFVMPEMASEVVTEVMLARSATRALDVAGESEPLLYADLAPGDSVESAVFNGTVAAPETVGMAAPTVAKLEVAPFEGLPRVANNADPLLPSDVGGTGANYDKVAGQGLYVLRDENGVIRYVGRGDAPARLATHEDSIDKGDLIGEVLWTNNLSKAQAKGLEQQLIDFNGGAARQNPETPLLNEYRSYAPENPNATLYKNSVTEDLWLATLKRLGLN